jgi:hypothetical protein
MNSIFGIPNIVFCQMIIVAGLLGIRQGIKDNEEFERVEREKSKEDLPIISQDTPYN